MMEMIKREARKKEILEELEKNPEIILFATENRIVASGSLEDRLLISTIVNELIKKQVMETYANSLKEDD